MYLMQNDTNSINIVRIQDNRKYAERVEVLENVLSVVLSDIFK